MRNQSIQVPTWYWVAAVIFLLWNLMGLVSFLSLTIMKDQMMEALPLAEQELYNSFPFWTYIVFAIAVFGGIIGCIGLLMRKKWAKVAFIISLVGIVPQMTYNIFFSNTMAVKGITALIMPIMIVVVGFFLVWYADSITKRGWLK